MTLRTDILVPPLVLSDTPEPQVITALALQVTFDDADEGRGLLTFEVGTPTVNTFGDVLEGPTPVLPAHDITVRPLLDDPITPRRLYTLTLTDGRFPDQLVLVRGLTPEGPHRLLIRRGFSPVHAGDKLSPDKVLDRGIMYVLALHSPPTSPAPQDATPLPPTLHWATLSNNHGSYRRLTVCGTLDGPALLDPDPNRLFFNAFGDVAGFTAMLGWTYPATLQPLPDPDPTGQGRRLFEVVLTPPELKAGASRAEMDRYMVFLEQWPKNVRYVLVVAPTTAGPHRLLVWENGRVQQLLHDPQRGYSGTQVGYNPTDSPLPCHSRAGLP